MFAASKAVVVCLSHTPGGISGRVIGENDMKSAKAGLLTALLATALAAPAFSQSMPKVGDMAPDFTLKVFTGNDLKEVKLSDYRGKKNVVLAFYIFAFTGG